MWAFLTAAIPIERQQVNRKSADLAAEMMEEGWNLLIYPEGGRSPDGWMQDVPPRGRIPRCPNAPAGRARASGRNFQGDGTRRRRVRRSPTTVTFGCRSARAGRGSRRAFGRRIEEAVHLLADRALDRLVDGQKLAATGSPIPGASGPDASAWRRSWALRRASRAKRESPKSDEWALHRNR